MSEHELQYVVDAVFAKSKSNSDKWNYIKTISVLIVGFSTVFVFGRREGKIDSFMSNTTEEIKEIKSNVKTLLESDHKERMDYIKSIKPKQISE